MWNVLDTQELIASHNAAPEEYKRYIEKLDAAVAEFTAAVRTNFCDVNVTD